MNLKNIDWKHVVGITVTVLLAIYATLVADGVPMPAKVAAIAAALTSVGNWLNGSPIASARQIADKTTLADMRIYARKMRVSQEDKTK